MANVSPGNDPASALTQTNLTTKPNWLPSRKIISGGVGGILAWGLFAACSSWLHFDLATYVQPYVTAGFAIFGVVPAPSAQGGLAILIGGAIAYYTPPSARDIYLKLNNRLIALALADPKVPVTLAGVAKENTVIQANLKK